MPVNEPRWLTAKIEIVVMLLLFLVCLVSDVSKCKTGLFASCLGGWVSVCDRDIEKEWCYDYVIPYPFLTQRSQCDCTLHKSSVLFHVIQIGAPVAHVTRSGVSRSVPIAPYIAQSLLNRVGNVIHTNNTKGFLNASYFVHFRRSIEFEPYDKESTAAQCKALPFISLQASYSHDTLDVSGDSSLITDLSSSLPFKNDYFAIRRYFPRLHRTFERLVLEKRSGRDSRKNPCSLTHLVILLALTPGIETTWAHENATRAAEVILEAHTHIRRTISRYLRKKPRYTRMLSSVVFVSVPIGYPARGAQNAGNAVEMMTRLCPASGGETTRRCRVSCARYQQVLPNYREANNQLRNLINKPEARRPQVNTVVLPYRDYFDEGMENRSQWDNCLILSQSGALKLSEKIVNDLFSVSAK